MTNLNCCGGNDDALATNGHPHSHTMDCSVAPGEPVETARVESPTQRRQSLYQLRDAILNTLRTQASTSEYAKTLLERSDWFVAHSMIPREAPIAGHALLDAVLQDCAANLASIVDMLCDIAEKGE